MKHTCHAMGCAVSVPPRMFMCRRHWFMLPELYRQRIWSAYRPGQEEDKRPSSLYLKVSADCIEFIAKLEGKWGQVPAV